MLREDDTKARWQEICKHIGRSNVVALKRNGAYAQYI